MSAYASNAFAGVAREEIVVALSHHPEFFPIGTATGAQLTLASHTYGGPDEPLRSATDQAIRLRPRPV
jgi:uncharacterized protein